MSTTAWQESLVRVDVLGCVPVENCAVELTPVAKYGSGTPGKTAEFACVWYRAAPNNGFIRMQRTCANPICERKEKVLQCFFLHKHKVCEGASYFCSPACFRVAFFPHIARARKIVADGETQSDQQNPLADMFEKYDSASDTVLTKWIRVGTTLSYKTTRQDVGSVLRAVVYPVNEHGALGMPAEVITEPVQLMPPPPPPRKMIMFNHVDPSNHGNFRVLTYNILADIYATNQVYPYCESWALQWPFRRERLMREISSYKADVIALQEVQADVFENTLQGHMESQGYTGLYKMKARSTMGQEGKMDGCAFFFRHSRFALVQHNEVDFDSIARSTFSDKEQLNRLIKGNVAHIFVMEVLVNGQRTDEHVIFCNTHLFWDPECTEVKIWQASVILNELERLSNGQSVPIVLCGDLNSLPTSAVLELITRGSVRPDHKDMKKDATGVLAQISKLSHSLPLQSSYAATVGEAPYTNYTGHFVGTLDYIFFSTDCLRVNGVLEILSEDTVTQHHALPSVAWSSDHMALAADLQLMSFH